LNANGKASASGNPVASALMDTITRASLPVSPLLELLDARLRDIYNEPIRSVAELEFYTRAAAGGLFELAAQACEGKRASPNAEAASHAGIVYGMTGLLRALPWHCARRKLYIPEVVLKDAGADPQDFFEGRASPAVFTALTEMRALTRKHLQAFGTKLLAVKDGGRAAFLAVGLCEPYLRKMEEPTYNPFYTPIELPQWKRQWILWRTARRWTVALRS